MLLDGDHSLSAKNAEMILAITVSALAIGYLVYQHRQQRKRVNALQIITQLYQDQKAFHLSKAERLQRALLGDEWVYGEIGIHAMRYALKIAKPKPHETFIDLGSGSGIAVLIAAVYTPMKTYCGVEYLQDLHSYSQSRVSALLAEKHCPKHLSASHFQFIHGNYSDQPFHQYDIVYLNATAMSDECLKQFHTSIAELKKGARVIITSKKLPENDFELLDAYTAYMSWGYNRLSVYRKK